MKRSDKFEPLRLLIDAVLDQEASEEEKQKLKFLLENDSDAQAFYFDYIELHTRLKDSADSSVEFVYRRMTEEELIVRPANTASVNIDHGARVALEKQSHRESPHIINQAAQTKPHKIKLFAAVFSVLSIVALFFLWQSKNVKPEPFTAMIFSGVLSPVEFGQILDNRLTAGEYIVTQQASIGLRTGETLNFVEGSYLRLVSNNNLDLMEGALTIIPVPNNSITVNSTNFTAYSNGGELSIDLRHEHPIIKTGDETLLTPHQWRPMHYWSFDGSSDRAIDSAGNADGVVYPGASRTAGLLGAGAFAFDNSMNTRLNLGNGGGSALGTGSFSATDGVTVEALIQPKYSGKLSESDHIFRKGQADGQFRILLSLQNDRGKNYLRPEGDYAESISFGLFLLGQGYHELKLPLDGLEGRPTLEELKSGEPVHVVATYHAASGLKAIYLNGQRLASYQYPPGSKMLSGGPGEANIGNSPSYPRKKPFGHDYNANHSGSVDIPLKPSKGVIDKYGASFNGVIDEVAFYNFALTDMLVQKHFKNIPNGKNYFGLIPSSDPLPSDIKLQLPANQQVSVELTTGQPISKENK